MTNPPILYGMPNQSVPVIEPDGTMNQVWYRFFQALYQRSGLATPGISLYGLNPAAPNNLAPAFSVNTALAPLRLFVRELKYGTVLGHINFD